MIFQGFLKEHYSFLISAGQNIQLCEIQKLKFVPDRSVHTVSKNFFCLLHLYGEWWPQILLESSVSLCTTNKRVIIGSHDGYIYV